MQRKVTKHDSLVDVENGISIGLAEDNGEIDLIISLGYNAKDGNKVLLTTENVRVLQDLCSAYLGYSRPYGVAKEL